MKTYILFISFLITTLSSFGQIGIGTTTPQGALDMGSSSLGLVYPRVALTSAVSQSPVINPNGGALEIGTTVYNTATTTSGANDVHPGIYSWDGTRWLTQYYKKEYQKFEQTGGCQRTTIRESNSNPNPSDADNVAGLTNQTFTPTFSGTYRVEVRTNLGAGRIQDFTSGTESEISLATMEGAFFFTMSGTGVDIDPTSSLYDYTEGWSYTHSYSSENDIESPAVESYIVPHHGTLLYHLYLLAGNTYTFNVSNCMYTGHAYFIGNGDTGDGRGHIGHYVPCSVEFEYIGD
ncbi:MAG: hypothetical protein HKN48_02800 [Flavobacteriaceae bacterium]|nr:hypothetical protein [Flavobacteriaceae bacterium]